MTRDTTLAAACLRSALVACALHCASSGAPSTFDAQMHHWELKDELGLAGLPVGVAPVAPSLPPAGKLFVGLSAYRDVRCGRTVFDVFTKATHPELIVVGVVDQVAPSDRGCVEVYCALAKERLGKADCPHRDQIRVKRVDFRDARGPTLARYYQQQLIRGEEYCLQMDAHSLVNPAFDEQLREQLRQTRNENAVLTTYVQDIADMGHPIGADHEIPHLCKTMVGEGGLPRNQQAIEAAALRSPKLTPLWGAGLSFSKCHAELRVPYDPHLPQIFDGEEFSRALRLFTHGYDMYTPSRGIVFHDYRHKLMQGQGNQVPWSFQPPPEEGARKAAEQEASNKRLRTLFRMPGASGEALGAFGLGPARTFEQFVQFSGVDPRTQKTSEGDQCGDVKWVPFEAAKMIAVPGAVPAAAAGLPAPPAAKLAAPSAARAPALRGRDRAAARPAAAAAAATPAPMAVAGAAAAGAAAAGAAAAGVTVSAAATVATVAPATRGGKPRLAKELLLHGKLLALAAAGMLFFVGPGRKMMLRRLKQWNPDDRLTN